MQNLNIKKSLIKERAIIKIRKEKEMTSNESSDDDGILRCGKNF